jgi:hypothetical protein
VPIELGADVTVARWLARESFEKKAASDGLHIIEYSEREVGVDEIPPKAMEQLGQPLTDFVWFEFTGLGELDQDLFDWLSAECAWRNDQIRDWLAAEKAWRLGIRRA